MRRRENGSNRALIGKRAIVLFRVAVYTAEFLRRTIPVPSISGHFVTDNRLPKTDRLTKLTDTGRTDGLTSRDRSVLLDPKTEGYASRYCCPT